MNDRAIHSNVLREARVSSAQRRAYDTLLPQFGIPYSAQQIDPSAVFGMNSPKILEIGFGMGESTAAPHAD